MWFSVGTPVSTSGNQIRSLEAAAVDSCTCPTNHTKHNTDLAYCYEQEMMWFSCVTKSFFLVINLSRAAGSGVTNI